MPIYKCPNCGREIVKPEGTYYCKRCGSDVPLEKVDVVSRYLDEIEKVYNEWMQSYSRFEEIEDRFLGYKLLEREAVKFLDRISDIARKIIKTRRKNLITQEEMENLAMKIYAYVTVSRIVTQAVVPISGFLKIMKSIK